jgi:pilus assembly protein FimV
VLKTLLKAVGLLVCLAWFNLSSAATAGGINVMSALGHPLKAEISLGDLGNNNKSTLVAKMASVNQFKAAGLDFPYSLPKLSFEVDTHSDGEVYIKLSTTQPVNEPFVSLLLELNWPSGKLLREYTFLLDPVGFVPEQPKAAEVRPVEPMVPVAESIPLPVAAPEAAVAVEPAAVPMQETTMAVPAEAATATSVDAMPTTETAPVNAEMVPAEQALAEPGEVTPAQPVKVEPLAIAPKEEAVPESILVDKGDTLGKIAKELKPVDVSLERMLVAMYRANTPKFGGKNMNRIRAGKILRMPDAEEIEKVTQKAAVREIRAQVADWQDYRQKLAAARNISTKESPKQEATGKISAAVAEKTPVIKDSAKEVLKLSKGEALGDKTTVGAGAKSKLEALSANADDATAKNKQATEDKKKIEKLEAISKDASKLVELKAQPAVPVEKPNEEIKAAPPKGLPPVSASKAPQAANDEFDIMALISKYSSEVLDDPVMLGAGVAVLLGLGGLGFVMARRGKGTQKKTTKKNEGVGEVTGSWRTPVAPSPDTGDFTQSMSAAPVAAMSVGAELDDVDPISEADLFLNFGRDAQAEEILKDALIKTPSNVQIKLKLLSIYANRKDSKLFSKYAQEVKDSGDTAAWERASVMGREVDPSNPTYGDAKGEVRHREPPKAVVDFDLGLGKKESPTVSNAAYAPDFKMDFDLTGGQPELSSETVDLDVQFAKTTVVSKPTADVDATSILSRETIKAAENASPMDFDVSGILPGDVKNITQSTSMDFDISGHLPTGGMGAGGSSNMDFDVTGGNLESTVVLQKPGEKAASSASAMNFNDLVFEIPGSEPAPAAPKAEPAKKVADDGAMAFTIDFPTDDEPKTSKEVGMMDFGDININLDGDTPPVHAGGEGKDEQWHEVATKLDLAKAYQEMGDADGAREILEEVVKDGDPAQRDSAEKLMQQISA